MLKQARARLNSFFQVHEVEWECFMVALAIAFVVLGFLPDLERWSPEERRTIHAVDWGLTGFFMWEFATRFFAAPSRKAYLGSHWLDLLALLPAIRFLRFLRMLRILRLLRLRALAPRFRAFDRFTAVFQGIAALHNLQWMLVGMGGLLLIGASVFFDFETASNPNVNSFGDAVWWALVTVATVGYGDIAPATIMGRVIGGILMFAGVGMWSLITANIAAYFLGHRHRRQEDPAIHEFKDKLERLDTLTPMEIAALRGSLDAVLDEKLREKERPTKPLPEG